MSARIIKYDAIVKGVVMGRFGYWLVTFSAEPGLDYTVTVCQTGISRARATDLATQTLLAQTGRKVRA